MTRVALKRTPEGKRKRGTPKTTWRRIIENEIKERGYTWGTIERKANNRETASYVIKGVYCIQLFPFYKYDWQSLCVEVH
jgi:hypothetical protein